MAAKKKKSAAYKAGYKAGLKVGKLSAKSERGSAGPKAYWLDMSATERAHTKEYIKAGLRGYDREEGIHVPGVRRVYSGFSAADGYDLRHIERWSAAKLKSARRYIQQVSTYTSRPVAIITPRTAKQRRAAQNFTGENKKQKIYFVPVQLPTHDKVRFKNNKVVVERTFKGGSKQIKQRFLFRDYLEAGKRLPITFEEMHEFLDDMLPDMPENWGGQWAYYMLISTLHGPIGRSVPKSRISELLENYHQRYEKPGEQHEGFAEAVVGFQMVGTALQAGKFQIEREHRSQRRPRKWRQKLKIAEKILRCPATSKGRQCVLKPHHKGHHKYTYRKKTGRR